MTAARSAAPPPPAAAAFPGELIAVPRGVRGVGGVFIVLGVVLALMLCLQAPLSL